MKRFAIAALALLAAPSVGLGQDYAALGQVGNTAVVERCQEVADRQNNDDRTLDGECIGAVEIRMVALQAALSSAELDQTIADLVVQLASIAQLARECNYADTEIAEAIARARDYSSDPDQRALLTEISATIASCVIQQTAALAGPEPEGGGGDDGGEASPN
jgi:hypothetical protein